MRPVFKREHMGSSINTPISKLLSSVTQLHLIVFKCEHIYKKAAFRREENTAIVGLFSSVNTDINYQGYIYCQSRVYSKGWPCRVTVNKNKQAHTVCRNVSNVALKFHQGELRCRKKRVLLTKYIVPLETRSYCVKIVFHHTKKTPQYKFHLLSKQPIKAVLGKFCFLPQLCY